MRRRAENAAARLPAHPVGGQPFTVTPAQVTLDKVGVHWSLGDAGSALKAGRGPAPGPIRHSLGVRAGAVRALRTVGLPSGAPEHRLG
jgi:hypothetical protein